MKKMYNTTEKKSEKMVVVATPKTRNELHFQAQLVGGSYVSKNKKKTIERKRKYKKSIDFSY